MWNESIRRLQITCFASAKSLSRSSSMPPSSSSASFKWKTRSWPLKSSSNVSTISGSQSINGPDLGAARFKSPICSSVSDAKTWRYYTKSWSTVKRAGTNTKQLIQIDISVKDGFILMVAVWQKMSDVYLYTLPSTLIYIL